MIRTVLGVLLALLLAALLAVAWLLGTTGGARWIAARAEAELPGLAVEVEQGSVWEGLALRNVAWDGAGLRLRAEALAFAWRPLCLLSARVCVDRLASDGLRVTLTAAPEADDEPAEPTALGARLSLPVTVLLGELVLRDTRVETPAAAIGLERLRSQASLAGDRLRVGATRLDGLAVELPETAADAGDGSAAGAAGDGPPALPTVALPLDIALSELTLAGAELRRGDERWRLDRLALAAELVGDQLTLERLEAQAPQGEASADGRLTLSGDWPLALRLRGRAPDLAAGEPLALDAALDGSVADLTAEVQLSEPAAARLEARVHPLAAEPEWRLRLAAEALQWPLAGAPEVSASGIEITARGAGARYQAEAAVGLAGPQFPSGRYRLNVHGDAAGAEIIGLDGELLGGRVGVAGDVGWRDGLRWDLALALGGLDPGLWREDLDGRLGGHVRVQGEAVDGDWSVAAELPGVVGELRGYPFALTGGVSGDSAARWRFRDLELVSGGNRLGLEGRLDEGWDARLAVAAPRLDRLWPGLAGAVSGDVRLGGSLQRPDVAVDLEAADLRYQDLAAAAIRLDGRVAERFEATSELQVSASGLRRGDATLGRLELGLEGRRGDHRLTLRAEDGPLPASLRVSGGLDAALEGWSGRIDAASLQSPEGAWRLAEPTDLRWRRAEQAVRIAPHCWRRGEASLCATAPVAASPEAASARLALERYPLAALDPWLPAGLGLDARLAGEAALDWRPGALPQVTLDLRSPDGAVLLEGVEEEDPVRFAWQRLSARLELDADRAALDLRFASEEFGEGRLQARVDPQGPRRSLDGEVALDGVELAPLAAFLPQLRDLEGRLAADGRLGGNVAAPAFDGEVRLTEGRVVLRGLASPLEAIRLTARIRGEEARLDGGFRAGDGEATVDGELDWAEGLRGRVGLRGESLALRHESLARVRISPDLEVALAPRRVDVRGEVAVPWARIRIRDLPQGAVPVSSDVVIVGDDQGDGDGEADPAAADDGGWAISSDIQVNLGDDVRFEGFGAKGRLAGGLRLRQLGAGATEAEGEIRFEDGRFSAYGQRLEIRRGRFLFAGPIGEPQLDIEAVRRVESVIAGLRVSGTASDPQVSLFSEPTLPQEDILAYLITGRPPGGGTPSEEALVAQAALSLGVFGGRNIGGALAEELGVEDFQLEASGQGEESEVAVSGYIAPNLLVRYGVGVFQPGNTLTLRYYLTERLFLEAVSGAESALDIFYSFDF